MNVIAWIQAHVSTALIHQALEMTGVLGVLAAVGPHLLAWGLPLSVQAGHVSAKAMLGTPWLREIIIWKAPVFLKMIDDIIAALEKMADTFKATLEGDIQSAVQPPQTPPAP